MTDSKSSQEPNLEVTHPTIENHGDTTSVAVPADIVNNTSIRGLQVDPSAELAESEITTRDDYELVLGLVPVSYVKLSLRQQMIRAPIFFILTMFGMCGVLNFTTYRYPDPQTQLQLPDLGFDLIPRNRDLKPATDAAVWMANILGISTTLALYFISSGKLRPVIDISDETIWGPQKDLVKLVWIRYFLGFGIGTFLRIITICMTSLPTPNNECKVRPTIENPFMNSVKGFVTFGSGNIHCGDLLYSGHTVAIMISVLTAWCYGPIIHPLVRAAAFFVPFFGIFAMLGSRSHYSNDILVAMYVMCTAYALLGHQPRQGAPWAFHMLLNPAGVFRWIQRLCGGGTIEDTASRK